MSAARNIDVNAYDEGRNILAEVTAILALLSAGHDNGSVLERQPRSGSELMATSSDLHARATDGLTRMVRMADQQFALSMGDPA